MKRIILSILLITPLSLFANDGSWRYYVGVHGNASRSVVTDGNMVNFPWETLDNREIQRIDNGNISGWGFSITAGMEQRQNRFGLKNIKLLVGGELFYDHIGNTITQGYQTWQNNMQFGSFTNYRRNAGEPIHSTNFLAGIRGKIGFNLFDRFDIYGHGGLVHWNREYYLRENRDAPYWGGIEGLQTLPILPFIGLGAKYHIDTNWAINASYMTVLPALYDASGSNFANRRASVGMDVFTLGILYYF